VPLFGWQITGEEFSSEPISIATNKLPIRQGEKHLTVYFGNRHETCATLHLKRGGEILQRKTLSVADGYLKLDLASYRDIANANPELDFIFTVGNDVIPVLRTFKEWEPKITHRIESKTVTLTIQDNAEGFRNRELILWNLCRLWEKPTIVPIPDGENEIIHTFEHEGEYGIQARIKPSGWGRAKELSIFDAPSLFNAEFRIGKIAFRDFLRQREDELRKILLNKDVNKEDIPVREQEFIATLTYLLKKQEQDRVKKWIHLFLALPEAIHNCFQAALYSETHPAVEAVRGIYEQMIKSILNGRQAYVTQLACVDVIEVKFSAERYQQDGHDGFMLRWNTNADSVRIIGIPNARQPREQRFVKTDALRFYTLIAGNNTAIATVAVAREPLIVCFQAVQLDNTRFRLVWNVLQPDEVELSTQGRNERVQPNGMKEVQPEHGQEFTLTAIAEGKDVPHKTIKTEFARPYIQKFEATEIEDDTVTLCWETLRADSVRIEPNIGVVEPSGEMEITVQQLQAGIRLLATNRGGTEERELAIDFDEMPFWFQEGVVVKIEHNEWTFYAKVSNLLFGLFGRTGQLTFAKMRAVDFTILYSKANRVYVKLNGDAMPAYVLELSSCRMPEPLSDLDNLINSLR
jgi:hypothetical protein